MERIEKNIKVNDERIIRLYISKEYPYSITITEYFIENDELSKNYTLNQWDDYGFSGWINTTIDKQQDIPSLTYDFDKKHPFYIPLLHLLRDDEYLLIDDDDTRELNKKYMLIAKNEDKIALSFINNKEKDDVLNKFHIFIKNIVHDGRSKIDCFGKDTKERLYFFFEELVYLCLEDRHQISIEEYLINTKGLEDNDVKEYVKSMIPKRNK